VFGKYLVLLYLLLLPLLSLGQISREHFAERSINKQRWSHAHDLLKKAMHKDSLNTAAQFVMAHYFFEAENPAYQIDSAYRYTVLAGLNFRQATSRQRDRLKHFPIDSLSILNLRMQIDSAAFERAKKLNTEKAYLDFLDGFTNANQRKQAKELRDEAAYLDAIRENTYTAFEKYFSKYPSSTHAKEAKDTYEKLLYQSMTADKRLVSYETFLKTYPESPYRKNVEQSIFEIGTADGTPKSYETFLKTYPQSTVVKKARNILFHILNQPDRIENTFLQTDSLNRVVALEKNYLIPILHIGQIGFMNEKGEEIIHLQESEIADDYLCGNISEDIIVLSDKIISPSGSIIYHGAVKDVEDIGSGFLIIEADDCMKVLHKSGFIVGDSCVTDAKVLSGKLIALKKGNAWSVWTFSGRMLVPFSWEDISTIENILLFKKGDKIKLATVHAVAQIADQHPLKLSDAFDEVKEWSQRFLHAKSGEYEGVLNQELNTFIRFDKQTLTQAYLGGLATSSLGSSIFNADGKESSVFRKVQFNKPWTAVKVNTHAWRLFNVTDLVFQSSVYDTIHFVGPFAIGNRRDSISIYFNPNYTLALRQPVKLEFIPGKDSTAFLSISQDESKVLYDGEGRRLFNVPYDGIQYVGEGMFIVSKKDKKGLVYNNGKLLLPIEYDAIGSVKNNTISILKAMKFGLFETKKQKLIKPEYIKNIIPYTLDKLVVFKDGGSGFVGWDNKPLSKFEFDEVRYWNDTSAIVKSNFFWKLYDIRSGKILIDRIKDYKLIQDNPQEKIAIIHQDNTYGVIHNHKGVIIPSNFSDIINVGSRDLPLYFTEKHVEEASLFVVIYYDHNGQMLRKEVYEHDDYERIYCSDN